MRTASFKTHNRRRLASLVIVLALGAAQCAYDSSKGKRDPEWDRTLYLLLTRPTESQASTACATAEDQALSCATLATGSPTPYLATLQSVYGAGIPGAPTTGAAVCQGMYSSPLMTSTTVTITAGAKLCHAQCNLLYWQNNAASCTLAGYNALLTNFMLCGPGVWSTGCTVTSMKECLKQCFITGTPLWYVP